ncbi:MAG: ABC-F family ATP-binding cassette domain-containing protein [Bacteroidales bacterium]|jgi:ATP-binding cassette subfamily F protein uup|nr:ABC-F family ATP-binding cassette domain-containing protein [Bacteroidales bacterium]
MSCLQAEQISKSYGDLLLFRRLTLNIAPGARMALIARNGAGKTSLLNILAGKESPDEGRIIRLPGLRIGYLEQEPAIDPRLTAFETVFAASGETVQAMEQYRKAVASGDKLLAGKAAEQMEQLQAWEYEAKVKQVLGRLNITRIHQPAGELSGGQRKRLALAALLVGEPDLFLLDEPTNHLDMDMTEWLEEYLRKTPAAFLLVTHDRYFLDRLCTETVELGSDGLTHYRGNYAHYLEKKAEKTAADRAETDRAKNLLRSELQWMRRMPKARGTKSKYRTEAFEELREKARSPQPEQQVKLAAAGTRLGGKILLMDKVEKRFGEKVILRDFSLTVSPKEKIGLIGGNGTGKTTFVNLIMGDVLPDSGTIEHGETVVYGCYRQSGMTWKPGQRVIDPVREIAETVFTGDGRQISAARFLSDFLFPPERQRVMIDRLSGGEKRRLYLATILMRRPNFLILDEPTNDLDVLTLNLLEEYLQSFGGCLIVVSHDRYFMDKTVDRLLIFRGDGKIDSFTGNCTQYRLACRKAQAQEQEAAAKTALKKPLAGKSPSAALPAGKPTLPANKPTYRQRKEMEETEAALSLLEAEKAAIEQMLGGGEATREEVIAASARMGVILSEIDAKTDRWLQLSEQGAP